MEYVKDLCNSDAHPEMVAAGFWGRFVFRELVRVAGQFDLRGVVPKKYATPGYLAKRSEASEAGIEGVESKLADGLRAAASAGLIVDSGDAYEIPGWGKFYESAGAVRQRRYRERHKDEPDPDDAPVTRDGSNVTGVTVTPIRDETRRDETPHGARAARVGVGDPAFEAVDHWRRVVWPKLSPADCPLVTQSQKQSLAVLSQSNTAATVCAAMDRAAADGFWADKIDLDSFIAKFPRFLPRREPPGQAKRKAMGSVGSNWDEKPF
jgi:hypothetical protein